MKKMMITAMAMMMALTINAMPVSAKELPVTVQKGAPTLATKHESRNIVSVRGKKASTTYTVNINWN